MLIYVYKWKHFIKNCVPLKNAKGGDIIAGVRKVPDKIFQDKRVSPEAKIIYSYIYSNSNGELITTLNVGELQPIVKIKNEILLKHLDSLEKGKYLIYKICGNGIYLIHLK